MYRKFVKSAAVVENDEPTTRQYVPEVIHVVGCAFHGANQGDACWSFPGLGGRSVVSGICNQRAFSAGFDANINPASLRTKRQGSPRGFRR